MPYKSEKLRLNEKQDRRVKLTVQDKQEIQRLYATGDHSHLSLAKLYGVSKSLIGIVVNPERVAKVKDRMKEHWKDYADREKLTKATRELRAYKQGLYLKGELK